ncbi:Hypothetical protein P9515_11761 [Prochlorococcus marinus str. MIT 9515]|uniref:Uncharacterized protein n=1 Tax=Prochlorococcus marinus (strain MIT 9515) TaxID=167542 RepID=A2BX72_PROM5|nr:hypothetical protein [Prochlorococcus marinus]ABM72383.1 Hypothetical protein P9515_11761 [Prochlorococcus marinus str. MIT 9515]
MISKNLVDNFIKFVIKSWLKSVCTRIEIHSLNLILNKNSFGKIDAIKLVAENIIYEGLYINKIIIKIFDCNLKFNYRNHLVYSEDLIINSFLTIDARSLENTFFSKKCKNLRKKIEKALIKSGFISNIFIINNLINCNYNTNKLSNQIFLLLYLKENLIFLEDIKNKNKIFLPLDKNIKVNYCNIKNEVINVDLSSKVIFDD